MIQHSSHPDTTSRRSLIQSTPAVLRLADYGNLSRYRALVRAYDARLDEALASPAESGGAGRGVLGRGRVAAHSTQIRQPAPTERSDDIQRRDGITLLPPEQPPTPAANPSDRAACETLKRLARASRAIY